MSRRDKKRLIVPLVLAVTVLAAACTSTKKPRVDAGTGDGPADVPIV